MTATTFSELELDDRLIDALRDKGYDRPTAIQAAAIPPAMDGRDVLGSAPTGTGKTAAFLLPVLQHLLDFPRKKSGPPRVLILTPTRELAMQVADQARELAAHTSLDIATITGGVAYMNHAEVFSENQDVVVATTGRLLQYIKEENFDCRAVETLILDEADRMLDMGFAQDIETISAAVLRHAGRRSDPRIRRAHPERAGGSGGRSVAPRTQKDPAVVLPRR
jgi:ATP-dependent RNA helicase SrmB